mgnify:CR=1 FL=1
MSDLGDFTGFDDDDDDPPATGGQEPATGGQDAGEDPSVTDDGFETLETTPAGTDRGIGVLSASAGLQVSEDERETGAKREFIPMHMDVIDVDAAAVEVKSEKSDLAV